MILRDDPPPSYPRRSPVLDTPRPAQEPNDSAETNIFHAPCSYCPSTHTMNELRQHHLTPLVLAAQEDYNFAFIGKYSRSHEGFAFYCVKHSTCFQWLNVQRLAGSIHDLVVQDTEVLSHYPEVLQADHRLFTQNMSDGLKAFLPRQVQDTLRSQPDFVPRGLVPLVQALLQRGKPGPQLELPEVFAARKAATLAADAMSVSMQSSMSGMSIDGNNYHGQHDDDDDEAEGMSLAGASYNAGNVPSRLGLPPVHGARPAKPVSTSSMWEPLRLLWEPLRVLCQTQPIRRAITAHRPPSTTTPSTKRACITRPALAIARSRPFPKPPKCLLISRMLKCPKHLQATTGGEAWEGPFRSRTNKSPAPLRLPIPGTRRPLI